MALLDDGYPVCVHVDPALATSRGSSRDSLRSGGNGIRSFAGSSCRSQRSDWLPRPCANPQDRGGTWIHIIRRRLEWLTFMWSPVLIYW